MERSFKVLKFGHIFVDLSMLGKGIYATRRPKLLDYDTTMDSITEWYKKGEEVVGRNYIPDSFFDNLKQCELKTVLLLELD